MDKEDPISLVPENFKPKQNQPKIVSLWQLNFYVLFYSTCAAFNSLLLGFDIGVMGGVMLIVKDLMSLNDWQVGFTMGALHICAIFGTYVAGYLSDRYGRTKSMCGAAVLFFVGGLVLVVSNSFVWLVFGRIVTGLGLGLEFP